MNAHSQKLQKTTRAVSAMSKHPANDARRIASNITKLPKWNCSYTKVSSAWPFGKMPSLQKLTAVTDIRRRF